MASALRSNWAVLVCLGLLSVIFVVKASVLAASPDAEPYHARIRGSAERVRLVLGVWVGQDVPVPRVAIKTLKPNVILSRQYTNLRSRQQFSLLVIQCGDARDLVGHYPPQCYPSQGWEQRGARVVDWEVDGLRIEGMQYQFVSNRFETVRETVVDNFMVLPNGSTCRDLRGVGRAAKDFRQRAFGAAQVQVITDVSMTAEERREVFETVVRGHRELIDAILAGGRS